MNDPKAKKSSAAFAYEPDRSLRDLVGHSTVLTDIFTQEKIDNCQKLVDDAKGSFFDSAQADVDIIHALIEKKEFASDYQELCRQLFKPVTNIKGQAELFGFALIARVCKYLIEYCENSKSAKEMSPKDIFILTKLVEALIRAFKEKIVDAGGTIEKELMEVVEQARSTTPNASRNSSDNP